MQDRNTFGNAFKNRKILVTGNTGFTGAWASIWLKKLNADVLGYSLAPQTTPSMFEELSLQDEVETVYADIMDKEKLQSAFERFEPELVLHLAAQPLVREGYRTPLETFAVNAQGSAHVLEAARLTDSVKAILCVTTDKVYKNDNKSISFSEAAELGGNDPYSASKSCAELIAQSYRASFPNGPKIATARAGNIVGGGDWSDDRLIPDFIKALTNDTELVIRNPNATRPWQHVLAALTGYFTLLSALLEDDGDKYAGAWNFGPSDLEEFTVRQIVDLLGEKWRTPTVQLQISEFQEAQTLAIDSSKAAHELAWHSPWNTRRTLCETIEWYRTFYQKPADIKEFTIKQIDLWGEEVLA
ncbi:CDP-glucose 4,6-dehydratase [Terasakiella sp.]|uniref:CDP-glucose 4,6-dehydratase n=1 Tax=Terasakiella sp. TaxID=2034861 RepID=UPI003AA941B5